jgi:hypothetical protein
MPAELYNTFNLVSSTCPSTFLPIIYQLVPIFAQVSTFMFRCEKQCPLYRVQNFHPPKLCLATAAAAFAHDTSSDMQEVCHQTKPADDPALGPGRPKKAN